MTTESEIEVRIPLLSETLPSGFNEWSTDVQNSYLLLKMAPQERKLLALSKLSPEAQNKSADTQKLLALSKLTPEQLAVYQQDQQQVCTLIYDINLINNLFLFSYATFLFDICFL